MVCVHFFIYLSDCFLVDSTEVYDFGVCLKGLKLLGSLFLLLSDGSLVTEGLVPSLHGK